MSIHTMELGLSDVLFYRLERSARLAGISMTEFALQLIHRSLGELTTSELEQQEIDAYKRFPVKAGEFDDWESEQVWDNE